MAGLIPAAQAVTPIPGGAPTLTPVVINAGAGDQYDPHVSGDLAAYTSDVSIRYYRFSTNIDAQIPMGSSARDLLSDVSGSKIVFSRVIASVKTAVMVFDASTPLVAPVEIDAAVGSNRIGSAIGGNTVAYIDFVLDAKGEVVVHDLSASTSVRITNDTFFDQNPSVSPDGAVVTWEHCATSTGNCDVWQAVKSGVVWTAGPTMDSTNPEANADSNGALVVYDSIRSPDRGDIFWRPVGGGAEVQLVLSGVETNPNIAGNFIAFESRPTLFATSDIFVYDITTNRLYNITNTLDVTEQLNDITVLPDGRIRVVWGSDEDGFDARNVRAATFSLPGVVGVTFAGFHPWAIIDLPKNAFAVGGTFTLAAASNGIAPLTEDVTVQVATFSITIPGGSFKSNGFSGFQFKGVVNGASVIMTIQPLLGRSYAFGALVWNASQSGAANPVSVQLSVGDDAGSRAVTAFFATVYHGSL